MAIAFGSVGSAFDADDTVPYPSSISAGDGLILFVQLNDAGNGSITTPSGWTLLASYPSYFHVFWKVATGSESGSLTITGSVYRVGVIVRYTVAPGSTWMVAGAAGTNETGAFTPSFSSTMDSNPGIIANDTIVCFCDSQGNYHASGGFSAEAVSATGISSWSAFTERFDADAVNLPGGGTNFRGAIFDGSVITGTASAAPVITATGVFNIGAGFAGLVRLREVPFVPAGLPLVPQTSGRRHHDRIEPLKGKTSKPEANSFEAEDLKRITIAQNASLLWNDVRDNWLEYIDKRSSRRRAGASYNYLVRHGGSGSGAGVPPVFESAIETISPASGGNITYPTTISAGARILMFFFAGIASPSPSVTTPSGWTLEGFFGDYNPFVLAGPSYYARLYVYSRVAVGNEDSTTFTISGSWSWSFAVVASYTGVNSISAIYGGATNQSTSIAATASSDPGLTTGDKLLACVQAYNHSGGYSAQVFTASGITFSNTTERIDNTAFPTPMMVDADVTGTSGSAPTLTTTVGATSQGGMVFVRLRG